jgi:hypothetical protein
VAIVGQVPCTGGRNELGGAEPPDASPEPPVGPLDPASPLGPESPLDPASPLDTLASSLEREPLPASAPPLDPGVAEVPESDGAPFEGAVPETECEPHPARNPNVKTPSAHRMFVSFPDVTSSQSPSYVEDERPCIVAATTDLRGAAAPVAPASLVVGSTNHTQRTRARGSRRRPEDV